MLGCCPGEKVEREMCYKKKWSMKCQITASTPFVSLSWIDYSLKPRSQPCLLFENIMQSRCCGHPRMSTLFYVVTSPSVSGSCKVLGLFLVVQRGVGKSFPWSQLLAYQPHNKGSLWLAAGGGLSRVCSRGWCQNSPRQVL